MSGHPKFAHREYTAADHELAYKIWLETGSFTRAAEAIGENIALTITVKNWSRPDFSCAYSCPYHGWTQLREKECHTAPMETNAISVEPQNAPPPPPVVVGTSSEEYIASPEAISAANAIRSDLERLQHWELLWAQAIYYGTGIVPQGLPVLGPDGRTRTEEELKEHFKALGLKPRSLEAVVRTLVSIQKEIDILAERTGLRKPVAVQREVSAATHEIHQLDVEAIRAFKTLYDSTPEDKRHALAQMFQSEIGVLNGIQETRPSTTSPQREDPKSLP